MKIEVPVIYRGLDNYIVEIPDGTPQKEAFEKAMETARQRFNDGEIPESLGNEWEEFERFGEVKVIEQGKQR